MSSIYDITLCHDQYFELNVMNTQDQTNYVVSQNGVFLEIKCETHLQLFRVRSWNNGMWYMSLYILTELYFPCQRKISESFDNEDVIKLHTILYDNVD